MCVRLTAHRNQPEDSTRFESVNSTTEQIAAIVSTASPTGVTIGWLGIVFVALAGAVTSWALVHAVLWYCRKNHETVRAGEFHHEPTGEAVPRFGGVALAGTFVVAGLIYGAMFGWGALVRRESVTVLVASLAMFGVGLFDDIKPLGARKKLLLQIIIALGAYAAGIQVNTLKNPVSGLIVDLHSFGLILTVIWLVAMTNLVNLVDGIDGLAGGVSLMLMCLLAYVSPDGAPLLFVVATAMAGGLLAFLRFNFPPARIYMGDGGAYFLGFLIGAMTIANSHKGTVLAALIAPVIALGLPIIDTALAIIRRGLKGLPLFRADRKHIHHRLMQRGLSRTKTVLLLYAISVVFLLMAFAMFWSEQRYVPIIFGMVFLVFLFSLQGRAMGLDWLTVGRSIGNSREVRKQTQYVMALSCWLEMEAERQGTLAALWEDFIFVARKTGFTRAKVVFSDSHRAWTSEAHVPRADLREYVFEFNPGGRMLVLLQCSNDKFDHVILAHLSELTAEAWLKAVLRWNQGKNKPPGFGEASAADEPGNLSATRSAVSPG